MIAGVAHVRARAWTISYHVYSMYVHVHVYVLCMSKKEPVLHAGNYGAVRGAWTSTLHEAKLVRKSAKISEFVDS